LPRLTPRSGSRRAKPRGIPQVYVLNRRPTAAAAARGVGGPRESPPRQGECGRSEDGATEHSEAALFQIRVGPHTRRAGRAPFREAVTLRVFGRAGPRFADTSCPSQRSILRAGAGSVFILADTREEAAAPGGAGAMRNDLNSMKLVGYPFNRLALQAALQGRLGLKT
jgi:hypothetical protein